MKLVYEAVLTGIIVGFAMVFINLVFRSLA